MNSPGCHKSNFIARFAEIKSPESQIFCWAMLKIQEIEYSRNSFGSGTSFKKYIYIYTHAVDFFQVWPFSKLLTGPSLLKKTPFVKKKRYRNRGFNTFKKLHF